MFYEKSLRRLSKKSSQSEIEETPKVKSKRLVNPRQPEQVQDSKDPLDLLSTFTDLIQSTGDEIRGKAKLS